MTNNKLEADTQLRPKRLRNISDLAKIAGVSAGTVSRALAGKEVVNPKTRERIQELAREYGFRPNQMARKLRTQETGVIGVVIPLGHDRKQHISDPFFMTLLGHLADALTEGGYDLMLSRVIPDQDEDWLDRIVDSGMLDGVLMIGQSDQLATIERVAAHYLPLVVWGSYEPGQVHCSVGTDNLAGGRMAATHLLERGRRNLAFFGDTRGIEMAQRLQAASEAVEKVPGATLRHFPVSLSSEAMVADIDRILANDPGKIDGIITASDSIAMAALSRLQGAGIQVPGEVAVIGYDDLPLASRTTPALSTIHQDISGGAQAMVDKLKARMRGDAVPGQVMQPELVLRATT